MDSILFKASKVHLLWRVTIDRLICIVLGSGSLPIQRIVELLTGGEITESLIRNRVDALAKSGLVKKHSHGITGAYIFK